MQAIIKGLDSSESDSPVRANSDLVTIRKSDLDDKESEIQRLPQAQSDELLNAARAMENPDDRLLLLEQAVVIHAGSSDALLELGKTYRAFGRYDEAASRLKMAVSLNPNKAESHRELGVCYNKQGKLALAVDAFEKALGLEPNDTLVQALLRDLGNRTFGHDGYDVLARPADMTWIVAERIPRSPPNWPQRGWSVQAVSGDVDPDRFHFVVQHAKPSGYAGEPQRIMTLWVYHMIEPGEAGRVGYFTATHCLCQHELRLALRYAWEFGPCIVGGSRH